MFQSGSTRRIALLLAWLGLLGPWSAAAQTISFPGFPANTATLGPIPDSPGPGCGVAGAPRDVTFQSPAAAGLASVGVAITLSHTFAGHLSATLIAPDGTQHLLFGRPGAVSATDCGSSGDLSGQYLFADTGVGFWAAAATTGAITPTTYLTSTMGGQVGGGTNVVMATVFVGKNAGGVWTLRLVDWGAGDTGSVLNASLGVSYPLLNNAVGDTYSTPANVPLVVPAPGILGNDSQAGGALTVWDVLFVPPGHGSVSVSPNGAFTYTPNAGFVGTDLFAYYALSPAGVNGETAVTITVLPQQPPTDLEVVSVVGRHVVMRWTAPPGIAPAGYTLRWGVAPGAPLGQIPLPPTPTALAVDMPVGVYYVSLQAVSPLGASAFTSEVAVNAGVPAAPSAPTAVTALVNGSTLTVHWKETYGGGAPTGAVLQVSGSYTGVVPASGTGALQASGVPPGTYTLSVRTTNATGASPAAAPVTVTVPGTCSAPQAPTRFVAFRSTAGRLGVVWDPPASGAAPERYEVVVSNALTATVPVGLQRVLEVPVAPGVYGLRVRAVNACGSSALTAVQTVVIP